MSRELNLLKGCACCTCVCVCVCVGVGGSIGWRSCCNIHDGGESYLLFREEACTTSETRKLILWRVSTNTGASGLRAPVPQQSGDCAITINNNQTLRLLPAPGPEGTAPGIPLFAAACLRWTGSGIGILGRRAALLERTLETSKG